MVEDDWTAICSVIKKKSTESEVILVKDQTDYAEIFHQTTKFAEDYKRDVEASLLLKAQLQAAKDEVALLRLSKTEEAD